MKVNELFNNDPQKYSDKLKKRCDKMVDIMYNLCEFLTLKLIELGKIIDNKDIL